jgi:hypothetical protein
MVRVEAEASLCGLSRGYSIVKIFEDAEILIDAESHDPSHPLPTLSVPVDAGDA